MYPWKPIIQMKTEEVKALKTPNKNCLSRYVSKLPELYIKIIFKAEESIF